MLPPNAAPLEPGTRPKPGLRLDRLPGSTPLWRWTIHREGKLLLSSDVTYRGAEAAWGAGHAALERLDHHAFASGPQAMSPPADEPRAASSGRPTRAEVVMSPELAAAVESWRHGQADQPTRPEAIRRLLELGLDAAAQAKPGQ